jgi:glutamate/tyrosine decarboxylase-like PLP-dependent enzyme
MSRTVDTSRREDLARAFAGWVDADPDWERVAPVSASTVCFRLRPRDWAADDPRLDALNARLLAAVGAAGEALVASAVVGERSVLRLVIGHPERVAVERAWAILRAEALRLGATPPVLA